MKFNVACIQLTCTNKVEENLQSITDYANEAIKAGADFILTPENSSLFSLDGKELLATSSVRRRHHHRGNRTMPARLRTWFFGHRPRQALRKTSPRRAPKRW